MESHNETIESIIEEQIWFAKTMLKDKGIEIPYLHPFIEQVRDPWEAVYFAMEELKQHLKEVNLWKESHTNIQAGEQESRPAHIFSSVV